MAQGTHTAGPVQTGHAEGKAHGAGLYILGYLASLVLTAAAFALALTHALTVSPLMWVLILLGILQIVVQLFFFMHVTEGDGPPFHALGLLLGLIFTFGVVLISLWTLTFHAQVA
ncbi:MAG: cytochrome C oxidase subunit IV family protein [Alicyclobacillus sp.]|nr:cytochrome C oxidase subunit IV family protein [Alicyclobacillus sp.]